jgi:altronate dehydratase
MKLPTIQRVARHPNTGWVVVVGASPLINFWLEALHKFTNLKFRVFNNLEDAKIFLAGIRRVEQEQEAAQQAKLTQDADLEKAQH